MSKPDNSTSSPPPPKNSPPPPSPSSSPPPPSPSPPPPSDKGSPPPPSDKGSPPPPSSNNDNKSSPPPPSDNKNDYNYKSPPPPPKSNSGSSNSGSSNSGSSNNGYSNSPSPPTSYSSSKSLPDSSSNENSSNFSSALSQNVMLIGLAAGAGLLLLIMAVFLISCSRRRKRKPRDNMHYYRDNSQAHTTNDYYQNSGAWANNAPRPSHDYRMPPSAQVSSEYDWPVKPPPPPPPMMISAEMGSRNSSGSLRHGLAPPPLHPQLSNIGYNQSSFTYDDLASATGGFASTNLLGQGGFGYVHKGVLPNGKEVAVKSLKANSGQGEREFQAEVDIISRVHHRHLVSLVGYCIAGNQRMLVYEFVANDTLESYLHGKVKQPMNWQTRHTIAVGSAKGFAYLHEDCHPRIIHRDIKASNILIDENFEAKVADFGLAKLSSDTNTHVSTRIMGTFGYLAPEYAASGKLSEKSDVYSFGVVLLELITGKRPIDVHSDEDSLVDWARPILTSALDGECGYEELADPLLEGNYDPQEMQRMIACAAACIRHSARRRPKMSQVVRALEGDGSLSDLDEGVKPSRQISTSSSEYDLRKMKKTGLSSQEFSSNEFGTTGEFAHSSGGESREMSSSRRDNVGRLV